MLCVYALQHGTTILFSGLVMPVVEKIDHQVFFYQILCVIYLLLVSQLLLCSRVFSFCFIFCFLNAWYEDNNYFILYLLFWFQSRWGRGWHSHITTYRYHSLIGRFSKETCKKILLDTHPPTHTHTYTHKKSINMGGFSCLRQKN